MAGRRSERGTSEQRSKIVTFYTDLSSEVDSHFAKALSRAAASDFTLSPSQAGKGTTVYPEFVNFPVHPEVDSYRDLPKLPGHEALPVLASSIAGPSQSGFTLSPSQAGKGTIVYPEFVNFLVHPEVDSYRDLPKLPGQTDSPPPLPLSHLRLRAQPPHGRTA